MMPPVPAQVALQAPLLKPALFIWVIPPRHLQMVTEPAVNLLKVLYIIKLKTVIIVT